MTEGDRPGRRQVDDVDRMTETIAFRVSAAIRREGNHVDVIERELLDLSSEIGALRTAVASYRSLAEAATKRADGYHEALHKTGICPDATCKGWDE